MKEPPLLREAIQLGDEQRRLRVEQDYRSLYLGQSNSNRRTFRILLNNPLKVRHLEMLRRDWASNNIDIQIQKQKLTWYLNSQRKAGVKNQLPQFNEFILQKKMMQRAKKDKKNGIEKLELQNIRTNDLKQLIQLKRENIIELKKDILDIQLTEASNFKPVKKTVTLSMDEILHQAIDLISSGPITKTEILSLALTEFLGKELITKLNLENLERKTKNDELEENNSI